MEWLSQNWTWILVIVGALWLLSRSRYGGVLRSCVHGAARGGHRDGEAGTDAPAGMNEASDPRAALPAPAHRRHRGGCC